MNTTYAEHGLIVLESEVVYLWLHFFKQAHGSDG